MKKLLCVLMLGMVFGQSVHLEIQNVNLDEGTLDIYMTNEVPVAGIQITFTGIEISGAFGGLSESSDFYVSTGQGEYTGLWRIIAVSITGSSIPAGEGILTTLNIVNSGDDICIPHQYNCEFGQSETCPENVWGQDGTFNVSDNNPVVSDVNAISIPLTVGDCYALSELLGCTYPEAINFNPDATDDDGSCEFMWGDVNHDGQLTIQDLILIVNQILSF